MNFPDFCSSFPVPGIETHCFECLCFGKVFRAGSVSEGLHNVAGMAEAEVSKTKRMLHMLNVQKYVRMATRYLYRCPDVARWNIVPIGHWIGGVPHLLGPGPLLQFEFQAQKGLKISGRGIRNSLSPAEHLHDINFELSSFHTFAFQPH